MDISLQCKLAMVGEVAKSNKLIDFLTILRCSILRYMNFKNAILTYESQNGAQNTIGRTVFLYQHESDDNDARVTSL